MEMSGNLQLSKSIRWDPGGGGGQCSGVLKATFSPENKRRTDKRFPKKGVSLTLGEKCTPPSMCGSVLSGDRPGLVGQQGTHRATALHTGAGHGMCPDRATEQEEGGKKRSVFTCVCVCVQLGERICVGLCQEMAELSGMRCLLHSFSVGVSIMRVTEACLCVGECFSAFCLCICTVCASPKYTIISSVCQFFRSDILWPLGVTAPTAVGDVEKPASVTKIHIDTQRFAHTHIQRAESGTTRACGCGLPDKL